MWLFCVAAEVAAEVQRLLLAARAPESLREEEVAVEEEVALVAREAPAVAATLKPMGVLAFPAGLPAPTLRLSMAALEPLELSGERLHQVRLQLPDRCC